MNTSPIYFILGVLLWLASALLILSSIGCGHNQYQSNYGKIPMHDIHIGAGIAPTGVTAKTTGNQTEVSTSRSVIGTVGYTRYLGKTVGFGVEATSNIGATGSIHIRW